MELESLFQRIARIRADFKAKHGAKADDLIAEIDKGIGARIALDPLLTWVGGEFYKAERKLLERDIEAAKPLGNGIEERLRLLAAHGVNAVEVEHIRMMAPHWEPGEALQIVGFHAVQMTKRTITRDEWQAYGRPESFSNDVSWARQFPAASAIRALEAAAAAQENPRPSRNINQDFAATGGVRPSR
jgi:hypothetical protein